MGTYHVVNKQTGYPETIEIDTDRVIRKGKDVDGADLVETLFIRSIIEWARTRRLFSHDRVLVTFEVATHEIYTYHWEIKSGRNMIAELEVRMDDLRET